jgi:Flp pilus assembly protein TadD
MSAAHALLGRLSLQQGDLEGARRYLSESIAIGNSDPNTREVYAMVLLDLGQLRGAIQQFKLVLQVTPNSTVSIGGIAVATARQGDAQKAIAILNDARQRVPNDANLDRAMNTILQMRKDQ